MTSSVTNSAPKRSAWRAEVLHHLGAEDALREARVVLDVARDHELAAAGEALDHERVRGWRARVERGGVAGGAAADDDQVANVLSVIRPQKGSGTRCVGPLKQATYRIL